MNRDKGFWDKDLNLGEKLMLITCELSEAMEAHRRGQPANTEDYLNDCVDGKFNRESFEENIKDSFEDEIADSIIRLLDLCGGLGIDIDFHVNEKLEYNSTRPRMHGKKY